MSVNDALMNVGATAMGTSAAYLALHTADPSTTGINPAASARVAAGWGAASGGAITATSKAFTGGAASGPVTHVGFWSASTGGTFYGSQALIGDQAFNAAGQYTINSVTIDLN